MTYTMTRISYRGRHRAARGTDRSTRTRWNRRARIVSAVMGCLLTGAVAFAASNWVAGLNSGSNGQGQATTVSNLTITATATPSPANLLFPGGTGDVVIRVSNPNPFPVT